MDSYKKDFQYSETDKNHEQSNIKVFSNYHQILFGQKSNIILYNTRDTDIQSSKEETQINITLPIFEIKSIYTINFKATKGFLNQSTIDKINHFVNSIKILGIPHKNQLPVRVLTGWPDSLNQKRPGKVISR